MKYSGAAVVAAGAAALGVYEYSEYYKQATVSPIPTASSTITPTQTPTPTSTTQEKLLYLAGKILYNEKGNGIQSPSDSKLADAPFRLIDNTGKITSTTTNSAGEYRFDVPRENYSLQIYARGKYWAMCHSKNDVAPAWGPYDECGYPIKLREDQEGVDFGVMEGILTQPVSEGTKFHIDRYYDWDPRPATSLWWDGTVGNDPWNHDGIDYGMDEGKDLLAMAPGNVTGVITNKQGLGVALNHYANIYTIYGHISKALVKEGDSISRGQKIAESGKTGVDYPHTHVSLFSMGLPITFFDPYHPIFKMEPLFNGYWINDGEFEEYGQKWVDCNGRDNPNLDYPNFWTKFNKPVFA